MMHVQMHMHTGIRCKHDDQDDDRLNTLLGIRQFFTCQNFPNPDLSEFSTVKILRHTVYIL